MGSRAKILGFSLSAGRVVLAAGILLASCTEEGPLALGTPFDPTDSVAVAELLASESVAPSGPVTVSGRIREVCRSAGCWFVLEDARATGPSEIYVDLAPAGTFTVRPGVVGREAFVHGRLVGTGPDRKLQADGLLVR